MLPFVTLSVLDLEYCAIKLVIVWFGKGCPATSTIVDMGLLKPIPEKVFGVNSSMMSSTLYVCHNC